MCDGNDTNCFRSDKKLMSFWGPKYCKKLSGSSQVLLVIQNRKLKKRRSRTPYALTVQITPNYRGKSMLAGWGATPWLRDILPANQYKYGANICLACTQNLFGQLGPRRQTFPPAVKADKSLVPCFCWPLRLVLDGMPRNRKEANKATHAQSWGGVKIFKWASEGFYEPCAGKTKTLAVC